MTVTSIEWTDETWNPVRGCSRAERTPSGARWTGKVALIPEKLAEPLSWRKPRRVFVNSDLFHESLPNEHIAAVFGIMAACPHLTFQVLTKREERMAEFFRWLPRQLPSCGERGSSRGAAWYAWNAIQNQDQSEPEKAFSPWSVGAVAWPLPNVWLGVSVEDLKAKARIDHLREAPASVRFLSIEPLIEDLGEVDLSGISWVIVGGESGNGSGIRPMHPAWVRSLRDQCEAATVPFFFKQWGEWLPQSQDNGSISFTRTPWHRWPNGLGSYRVGKKAAGRLFNGREWNEMPEVPRA